MFIMHCIEKRILNNFNKCVYFCELPNYIQSYLYTLGPDLNLKGLGQRKF